MSGRADAAVDRLVDDGWDLLEGGDPGGALERADAACRLEQANVAALHLRAAALAADDRLEDATAAYEHALKRGRTDLAVLAGAADFLINQAGSDDSALVRGLELARRGSRLAERAHDQELVADFAYLEGVALNELGDSREALAQLDRALAIRPEDDDARVEHALGLFETCQFDAARRELLDVLQRDPRNAWAQHTLGLIAERAHDADEARRRFAAAREEAPLDYPAPVALSEREFDEAVEKALLELPLQVRDYLSNVPIAVENVPALEDLRSADPPLSPSILGLFRGAPLGAKASMDPWSHFPSSIVLFQNNLQRIARDRRELLEQIRVTLLHEVGHFLGLDEEDLWERGLD